MPFITKSLAIGDTNVCEVDFVKARLPGNLFNGLDLRPEYQHKAYVLSGLSRELFELGSEGPICTDEGMDKTIAINQEIRPSSGQAFFFYPYPATDLYNLCKKHGLLYPETMEQVSGYKELPVIKLTHCKMKECVKSQQTLLLYFMARRLSIVLGIKHKMFEWTVHHLLLCWPSLFTRLFSKDNIIKRALRKLQYSRF